MGIKGMVARRVVPILLDVISRVPLSSSNRSRMPARPTRAPEKPSPKRCNNSADIPHPQSAEYRRSWFPPFAKSTRRVGHPPGAAPNISGTEVQKLGHYY
jgi:hypothetical protein